MPPSQNFIPIKELREGVVVLKNNGLRGVLMVSSLNFALKSDEEQKAVIYQFQNFINTLDFFLEIIVQSRRLNLTGYVEQLKELEQRQETELMKIQTQEYRNFIEEMLAQGIIMSKKFFVVVPFTLWDLEDMDEKKSILRKPQMPNMTEENFQRAKSQLWQRMEFVAMGLRRCGLKSVPLRTEEIIELFWTQYHPQQAEVGYYPRIPPELIR